MPNSAAPATAHSHWLIPAHADPEHSEGGNECERTLPPCGAKQRHKSSADQSGDNADQRSERIQQRADHDGWNAHDRLENPVLSGDADPATRATLSAGVGIDDANGYVAFATHAAEQRVECSGGSSSAYPCPIAASRCAIGTSSARSSSTTVA